MDQKDRKDPKDPKLRVPLPPDPNPRAPSFSPPPGTCDTHFHVYGPPQVFPYAEDRRYTPPAAPVEHYLAMAAAVGIERGVLVQSNVHGLDLSATLDGLDKAEGRLRGIIRADPRLSATELEGLHAHGVRGVRLNFVPALGGEFDQGLLSTIVARVLPLGWILDLHIRPDALGRLAEHVRTIPLPVVIDHFGGVDGRGGLDQPAVRTLLDLARQDNVWIKLSGAYRLVDRGGDYAEVVSLARALIAIAPDRLLWGTNWPHTGLYDVGSVPNDGELLNMVADFAPDPAIRRTLLADNPARLFGF